MTRQVLASPLTRWAIPLDPGMRVIALGSFAVRFGTGAVTTTSAIFFTHQLGFTNAQLAFSLGAAALLAMLVTLPAGYLGDTRGPRETLLILMIGLAIVMPLPALARQPWQLTVCLALVAAFQSSSNAVRNGIVAQIAGPDRVRFKAYMRAITNSAMALGALAGGLALAIDQRWAYYSVFALAAVMCVLAAINCVRLPTMAAVPIGDNEKRLQVLRDLPYVAVSVLTTIVSLHFMAAELGLALYIVQKTEAPKVMVSVLLVINTVLVATLQMRLSKGSDTVPTGARHLVRGGVLILVGFAIFGLAEGLPARVAIVVLILGSLVHVIGEMIGSGGQWGVTMGLAPHERQGQYQAFNSLGFAATDVVGPPLVIWLCVSHGRWGWAVMGLIVCVAAVLAVPVSRWALASRARYGVTTHSG